MKPSFHLFKSFRLPSVVAMIFLFLLNYGCSDIYEGPFIPEEEPNPFSGSVGYETFLLSGEKVSALDGMVALSFGATVPDDPVEVFVATFPVNHLDLSGHITTGRGFHLSLTPENIGVVLELRYNESHLKSVLDHFHEEDLTILRVNSRMDAAQKEEIAPIGPCELNMERNVISGIIYGSGTFVVGTD